MEHQNATTAKPNISPESPETLEGRSMFDLLNFGDGPTVDSTPTIQPKKAADASSNSPSQMTVNECDDNEPVLKNR